MLVNIFLIEGHNTFPLSVPNLKKYHIWCLSLTDNRSRPDGSRFGTRVARSCKIKNKVKHGNGILTLFNMS